MDAHPHIGTNKLPNIIKSMRNCIIDNGGEVHFNSKLTDINYSNGRLKNIHINDKLVSCKQLILATGHSARDIFYLLKRKTFELNQNHLLLVFGLNIHNH